MFESIVRNRIARNVPPILDDGYRKEWGVYEEGRGRGFLSQLFRRKDIRWKVYQGDIGRGNVFVDDVRLDKRYGSPK